MKDGDPVSVDKLLATELGWRGFGPAQALALFIGGFAYMTSSVLMFQMTFTYGDPLASSGPPSWHCAHSADSACVALLNQQLQTSIHLPPISHTAPEPGPVPGTSLPTEAAVKPPANSSFAPAPTTMASQTATAPQSFCDLVPSQYIWNDPALSFSSEYNLVCGQAWKASLLDTLFFAGFIAGNGVFGRVADLHGRRVTLAASAAATAALTALSASPLVPAGPGARAPAAAGDGGGGYWLHLTLRCLSGALCAGQTIGGYVLATETVGPRWRGAAGMLTQSFFIFGEFLVVGLSLAFPSWRGLTLATAASCAAVLLMLPLVPESPRWLLLHGKADSARAAFLWVARVNRVRQPPALECTTDGEIFLLQPLALQPPGAPHPQQNPQFHLQDDDSNGNNAKGAVEDGATGATADLEAPSTGSDSLTTTPHSPSISPSAKFSNTVDVDDKETETAPLVPDRAAINGAAATNASASTGLLTVLRNPVTRRLLLSCCFILFALSMSYYGVTLALGTLVAGSLHLNFFLTAVAELPAYILLAATTDRVGRRLVISGGTAMAGMACLACAFTSGGVAQVALAIAGKLGCSGAWALMLTFAAELFPTCLRSAALSVAGQSTDVGGIVTPFVLLMSPSGRFQRLPFAVMGLMSLLALLLVEKLPETRGMPQLDTFDELLEWIHSNDRKTATAMATAAAAAAPAAVETSRCVSRGLSASGGGAEMEMGLADGGGGSGDSDDGGGPAAVASAAAAQSANRLGP